MGTVGGPRGKLDGLIMAIDAGNVKSYPRTGSIMSDMSGNGNDLTLFDSPAFINENKGVIHFDGVSDYGRASSPNMTSLNNTVVAISRYNGSNRRRVVSSVGNNWLLGHWGNQVDKHYAQGWITSSGGGVSDTNWRVYAGSGNISSDNFSFYINGSLIISNANGSQGPNGIELGRGGNYPTEISECEVALILVYNRVLSSSEIRSIYVNYRGRFGL